MWNTFFFISIKISQQQTKWNKNCYGIKIYVYENWFFFGLLFLKNKNLFVIVTVFTKKKIVTNSMVDYTQKLYRTFCTPFDVQEVSSYFMTEKISTQYFLILFTFSGLCFFSLSLSFLFFMFIHVSRSCIN